MADERTLKVYADRVHDYAALEAAKGPGRWLRSFMAALPAAGRVLDLGCGPGHAAAQMRQAGLTVDAVDASPEMIAMANQLYDLNARQARFEQIDNPDSYDGIWANYSLLHAPRAAFPGLLDRLHRALKPGGLLHLGMKLGCGEDRDHLGRFYAYYSEAELRQLLSQAGFTVTTVAHRKDIGLAGKLNDGILVLAHG